LATPTREVAGLFSNVLEAGVRRIGAFTLIALCTLAGSCSRSDPPSAPDPARQVVAAAGSESVTGASAVLADYPAGEWRMQSRDFANTRYSPLDQIDRKNVARLRIAWTFATGLAFGHESAPLVVGDTMYIVTPFPNFAYAFDLSKPGTPLKWTYTPSPDPVAIGKACCDAVNRGAAYADGKLVFNLLDMQTVALDARTGKELWRTRLGNPAKGETMTMAPLIVGQRVIVGNSGGEFGVRGWSAALNLSDGKEVWRAYATGPDDEVRIGAEFRAPYDFLEGKDLGVSSWPKDAWKTGGGASWGFVAYDPKLNLIYNGTSNPGPRVAAQRPGLNLWTAAMFARDPDTGMARWAYQFTPHDQWDYDGINESPLIEIPFEGERRRVLVHLDRNGFAYTMDRETGEVLVAQPFAQINWSSGVDLETGMPVVVEDKQPTPGVELRNVCPTHIGSKDWQPSAFSPRTGLIYAGIFNICMDLTNHRVSYIAGTPYDGMEIATHATPGKNGKWGEFIAWNPVEGKIVWSIPEDFMTMSGTVATGGDLLFYGTADGWFRAVDAWSGEVLWSQRLSSGVISQPMTYLGPDGRQYVAVFAGVGGVASQVMSGKPGFPPRGGALYVFSIDGESPSSGAGMISTQARNRAARSSMRREAEAMRKPFVGCLLVIALGACDMRQSASSAPAHATVLPASQALPQVPLGDIASPGEFDFASIQNPYAGEPGSIQSGRTLYMAMNCAYCHGIDAGGLIGPSLKDRYWRYGDSPAEIYLSIFQGRPKGMPAWGDNLPSASLWQITAYIQSLGDSDPQPGKPVAAQAR